MTTELRKMVLPEGVKHLHGAMHLVRFGLLTLPDPDNKAENSKAYEYSNPRALTEKGRADIYDKKRSAKMRDSIRDKTLMNPFICRWIQVDGSWRPQIIGGECRYRGLDFLIHKKELVKDPSSAKLNNEGEYEYEWRPANQVYEYVLCQVYSAGSDLEALSLSYTENDCRHNLTDGHDIVMVMELRKCDASDEKVMEVMAKDERWLRDTDELINFLDADTLKDLIEDRIDRAAAQELGKIANEEVRTQVRLAANEESERIASKKIERLKKQIGAARDEQEIAGGEVADAKFHNDKPAEQEAEKKLEEVNSRVQRTIKEKDSVTPRTRSHQVRNKLRVVTSTDGEKTKCLRPKEIKKHYYETLKNLKTDEALSPDQQNALALAFKLVKGIQLGDKDCQEIVKRHYKAD